MNWDEAMAAYEAAINATREHYRIAGDLDWYRRDRDEWKAALHAANAAEVEAHRVVYAMLYALTAERVPS